MESLLKFNYKMKIGLPFQHFGNAFVRSPKKSVVEENISLYW